MLMPMARAFLEVTRRQNKEQHKKKIKKRREKMENCDWKILHFFLATIKLSQIFSFKL